MNRYADLKQHQQQEFGTFPMQYAFSNQQFAEGMAALGLKPADTDKIYKVPGGGFYRREDGSRLKTMMDRFDQELHEAVAGDKTGDGFIYEMFLYELENYEYGCTMDLSETLDALGYTPEDIQADPRLSTAWSGRVWKSWGGNDMNKNAYFFCMTVCHRRTRTPLGKRCGVVFADTSENAECIAWEKYGSDTACQLWVEPVPDDGFDFNVYNSEI